jgi:hypothetical protein
VSHADRQHEHGHVHGPPPIQSRNQWDEALADGQLTRADVEQRLHNIAVRDLGVPAGYDKEGFWISLVADGIQREGIGWFKVYPNDHDPPHVHVRPFGKNFDIRLSLETGEELDPRPREVKSKQIKNMKKALVEMHDELGAWWAKGEREPVVLSKS